MAAGCLVTAASTALVPTAPALGPCLGVVLLVVPVADPMQVAIGAIHAENATPPRRREHVARPCHPRMMRLSLRKKNTTFVFYYSRAWSVFWRLMCGARFTASRIDSVAKPNLLEKPQTNAIEDTAATLRVAARRQFVRERAWGGWGRRRQKRDVSRPRATKPCGLFCCLSTGHGRLILKRKRDDTRSTGDTLGATKKRRKEPSGGS